MIPDERVTTADLAVGDVIRREKKGRKRQVTAIEVGLEKPTAKHGDTRVYMAGRDGDTFVICRSTSKWYRDVP